jgi:hypothetical protein
MKQLHRFSFYTFVLALIIMGNTANAAGLGTNIAVRLVGTGDLFDGDALFTEFGLTPEGALCYDLDLVDVKTGNVIGSAADCLTNLNPIDTGVALTGTTFFFFHGGTVVSQGLTTVQPILHGSLDFTHITGAIPQPGVNSVVYGDGKFQNASGPVRLSGTVNLTNFPNQATFDCVFILDVGSEGE